MANSFLDKTGLTYLWGKIVALVNRKQDALTFDSTPTDNSTNPVTSGGVKAYVDANAGGGDSPFESGTGNGSAVLKNANNMALATYSTAEGYGTHAFGVESHTEGEDTYALGYQAHAEGYRTVAKGYAHSEGFGTTFKLNITGTVGSFGNIYACVSIPDHLKAGMHILKPDTTILIPITAVDRANKQITCATSLENTTGKVTVYCSSAYGDGSHVEGSGSAAFGTAAHAEGNNTGAKGANSHAEGRLTEANGGNSHAEGIGTIANSENQHVEGTYNVADTAGTGTYAHITGIGTSNSNRKNGFTVDWQGNGWYAGTVSAGTVENPAPVTNANDLATKAYVDANAGGSGDSPIESGSGVGSVQTKTYTVGSSTFTQTASGQGAFAEGCKTVASGMNSHAEGNSTIASGDYSHAEGISTQAVKNFSHAEGYGTITGSVSQHVEGRWNVTSSNYAHITGIGTDNNNRRNGFTVDWNGNGFFRGRLEVSNSGFSGWTDSTVVTKKYFNELSKTVVLLEDSNESYQVTLPSDGSIWSGHILVVQDLTYGPYPFVGHDYSTLRDYLYKYAFEYITEGASEGDSDRHLIPLTKVEVLSEASGNMYTKIVFGNNEKTYLAGGEGGYTCWIPESEWTPGIDFEFPYTSGE